MYFIGIPLQSFSRRGGGFGQAATGGIATLIARIIAIFCACVAWRHQQAATGA
jgi:hypothetical protein